MPVPVHELAGLRVRGVPRRADGQDGVPRDEADRVLAERPQKGPLVAAGGRHYIPSIREPTDQIMEQ